MKIIQRGEVELAWPRQITSTCCKSVLEIEPDDIQTDRDYTGGFNGYFYDCPVCGKQPEVNTRMQMEARLWTQQQERIAGND